MIILNGSDTLQNPNPKQRVLVVEDERIVADDLNISLSSMGYDIVATVSTGEEAIVKAETEKPDIVLIDIMLAGKMDGIEAAGQIRANYNIPVIYLTAYADNDILERAKKTEPFGYLLKPFSISEVHSSITIAIEKHRSEQRLKESELRLIESQRTAHVGSWEYNVTEDTLWWSAETYSIFGLNKDDTRITIERYLELVHKDDKHILEEQIRSGLPYRLDYRIVRPDGVIRHIHEEVRMTKDISGTPDIIWGTAQDISNLKCTENALRESEERYRMLIENQNELIIKYTPSLDIIYVNPNYCRSFGKSEKQLLESNTVPHLQKRDRERLMKVLSLVLEKKPHSTYHEEEAETEEGPRWFGWSSRGILDDHRTIKEIISVGRDITPRKQAEEKVLKSQRILINVLDGIEAIVYVSDMSTHKILYLNKYAKNIFGNVVGMVCWQTLQQNQAGPCDFCTNNKLLTLEGKPAGVCHWEIRNTVTGRWYDINDRAIEWLDGRIVRLEIATDITDIKEAENALRSMSFLDELTGLHNRRSFMTLANQQLKIAQREKNGMLLIFADLDDMKWINDTFGHPEGDRALKNVSAVLLQTFRESDIIARIGGDEFVVIAAETPEINIGLITGRLQSHLDAYNIKNQPSFDLSLSLGIVRYDPYNPQFLDDMLSAADKLMYKHKREKKYEK